MAYVKRRWKVEHHWTCSACGAQLQGRHIKCPSCGKPKSDERYDESNATSLPAVTDPKLIAIANGGANWDCRYCRFDNRGTQTSCVQCGAKKAQAGIDRSTPDVFNEIRAEYNKTPNEERDDHGLHPLDGSVFAPPTTLPFEPEPRPSEAVYPPPPEKPREVNENAGYRDAYSARAEDDAPAAAAPPSLPPPVDARPAEWAPAPLPWHMKAAVALTYGANASVYKVIGACGLGALVIAFFLWLLMPWHEHARVTSATWARHCELQRRETHHDSGWGSPAGAFNVSCVSRQHGTHDCNPYDCHPHDVDCRCARVQDGEDCDNECTSDGNGFSSCEEVCEPTYRTECDTCTEYDRCYEQCPTYDDWCDYDYYTWPAVARTIASGTDRDEGEWPSVPASDADLASGMYRVERDEEYHVAFGNQNGTWPMEPANEGVFHRFHTGATWDIQVTHAGTVTPIREEHQ